MRVLSCGDDNLTHIIHIADIHVRNGNEATARISEYSYVFKSFREEIEQLDCVKNGTTLLVIAGDVFHNKGRIDSVGGKMFFDWINAILELLPILVICGNHDYRQEDPAFTDAIDMFVSPYNNVHTKYHIHYLKDTGLYQWNNIVFGVTSVKDTLRVTSTNGVVSDLPPFPDPNDYDNKFKVALFHGTISQSMLPSNRNAESVTKGYPLDWFAGYDFVMLGDNHKQQVNTYGEQSWGYPGSLIQQDFGEGTFGHGYILWDLQKRTGSMNHIYNPYGAITVYGNRKVSFGTKYVCDIGDALNHPRFPKSPKLRLVGIDLKEVNDIFQTKGVNPSSVKLHCHIAETVFDDSHVDNDTKSHLNDTTTRISDLNHPQQWEAYIKNANPSLNVSEWLYNPASMISLGNQCECLPDSIKQIVQERTQKLQVYVDAFEKEINMPSRVAKSVNLKYIQWSYLMCFGENNHFDFTLSNGQVALLNGSNASGKSSFLDVISIALFGQPTSTRRDYTGDAMTAKIIHDSKPDGESSYVLLHLSVDDRDYEIYRTFMHATEASRHDNLQSKIQIVFEIKDDGLKYPIAEGSVMVGRWITENIGTEEEIQMSTVLCQHDTTNFFFQKPADQRLILERALHMETISAYEKLLEEVIKAHKYILGEVSCYHKGLVDSSNIEVLPTDDCADENVDAIRESIKTYENMVAVRIAEYESIIGILGTQNFSTTKYDSLNDEELSAKLVQIQKHMQDLHSTGQMKDNDHILLEQGRLDAIAEELEQNGIILGVDETTLSTIDVSDHDQLQSEYSILLQNPVEAPYISETTLNERKDRLLFAYPMVSMNDCEIASELDDIQRVLQQLELIRTDTYEVFKHSHSDSHSQIDCNFVDPNDKVNYNLDDIQAMADEYNVMKDELDKLDATKPYIHQNDVNTTEINEFPSAWLNDPNSVTQLAEETQSYITQLQDLRDKLVNTRYASACIQIIDGHLSTEPYVDNVDDIFTLSSELKTMYNNISELTLQIKPLARRADDEKETTAWHDKDAEWKSVVSKLEVLSSKLKFKDCTIPSKKRVAMRLDKYTKQLDTLNEMKVQYHTLQERYTEIQAEVKDIQQIEFNPCCEACKKQPKYIRLQRLTSELEGIKAEINRIKTDIDAFTSDKVQKIETTVNQLRDMLLLVERYHHDKLYMEAEELAWQESIKNCEYNDVILHDIADTKLIFTKLYIRLQSSVGRILDFSQKQLYNMQMFILYNDRLVKQQSLKAELLEWQQIRSNTEKAFVEKSTTFKSAWEMLHTSTKKKADMLNAQKDWRDIMVLEDQLKNYKEYKEQLEALERKLAVYKYCIDVRRYNSKRSKHNAKYADYVQALQTQEDYDVLVHVDAIRRKAKCSAQLDELKGLIDDLKKKLTLVENRNSAYHKSRALKKDVYSYMTILESRLTDLRELHRLFVGDKQVKSDGLACVGFKSYVYSNLVLPLIEKEVNEFVSTIESFRFVIRTKGSKFIFMVSDRGCMPTLDHASGYQKFIIGLGMRIALSRIGAVGQNVKHLFLDEGFVACDSENLHKIAEMLPDIMIHGGYKSMLLMSHLDVIRDAIQLRVNISRSSNNMFSYIRFGSKKQAIPKGSSITPGVPAKRRGRPPKLNH